MTAHDDHPWRPQAACRTRLDLFHSPALDYDPDDPDYAHLPPAAHAAHAAGKQQVERAALAMCGGCPVLAPCAQDSLRQDVAGVAGGRTEADRRALRAHLAGEAAEVITLDMYRDRGDRGRVNDAAVARLTAAGWTSLTIAAEIGCSERTVVRARARHQHRRSPAAVQPRPIRSAGAQPSRAPTVHGTPSRAMQAIYALLADGQWHHRDELLAAGMAATSGIEALAWWARRQQARGGSPAPADLPLAERIARGARDKVNNALTASCRTRGRTERGAPSGPGWDFYRLARPTAAREPVAS